MSLWHHLRHGVRRLSRPSAADREIADEVRDFLDRATADHEARGLSPDDARRAARLEIGGYASAEEHVRGYGWEHVVETTLADVRYAWRGLRAAPGFTLVVVLTLALGLGAATTIASAVRPILLGPVTYPGAERIATILEVGETGSRIDGTFGMYRWLAERSRSLESIAVTRSWLTTITGVDEPERVPAASVTASYFDVLGVPPAIGRSFSLEEDRANGPAVVVIGHSLWQRRFGSDPRIVGQTLSLQNRTVVVIGVMPATFVDALAPEAEIWVPLQYDMTQGRAWGHHLRTIGRLRPGVSLTDSAKEIDALGRDAIATLKPETYGANTTFAMVTLGEELTRGIRPALVAIGAAVGLVLVIACVNVTNLLLARGVRRRGEFALRTALGAGRSRLVRTLLTESLMLAVAGGAAGLAVAEFGVRTLVGLAPAGVPRLDAIRVDAGVFLFALTIVTIVGLGVGLIPARTLSRTDPRDDLVNASRGHIGAHHRLRRALVAIEVALALVVLVASGLLFRSLERLFAIPAGFDATGALTMQLQLTQPSLDGPDRAGAELDRVLDAVRQVPGVAGAAVTSQLPLSGDRDEYGVRFEAPGERGFSTFRYAVSAGYLDLMAIPVRDGRRLLETDRAGTPLVALISESLAAARFGADSPLGKRLFIGGGPSEPYTIVGVVGDLKQLSLAQSESAAVYTTVAQSRFIEREISLVVRTRTDPIGLAPAVRGAIASVRTPIAVSRIDSLENLVTLTAGARRFALVLFEAFALAALGLAAAGLYGILAGNVAERTREIGLRSALGAPRGVIVRFVLGQSLALTAAGAGLGLGAAALAGQAMAALLFQISPLDPITYVSVIAILLTVAMIAAAVPAWRAVRVDPISTLRAE